MFRKPRDKRREGQNINLLLIVILLIAFYSLIAPVFSQTRPSKKETLPATKKNSQVVPAKRNVSEKTQTPKTMAQKSEPAVKQPVNQAILKENKFLEEELTLAKNPQYYFVLNLKERKIELRARGMVLKSWTASQIRYSGRPVPLKVTSLLEKSALNPPQRKMIKPGATQTTTPSAPEKTAGTTKSADEQKSPAAAADSFELEALEITDMPGSYELILDNGLKISVRSKNSSTKKMSQIRELIFWNIWLPIKNFLSRKSEPESRMLIYFENQRDAQGLYWAFIDGIKGIIWLP